MAVEEKRRADSGSGLTPLALEYQPDAVEIEERPLPQAARWSLYLLALMLAMGALWASLSSMDQVVAARGRLVTTEPTIVVQPLETALIHEMRARVGQVVAKDQVLALLDPTFVQADLAQQRARLHSQEVQARRLEAELAGRPFAPQREGDQEELAQAALYQRRQAAYSAKRKGYDEAVARLDAALNTSQRDQQVLAERLKGLTEIEGMRTALHEARHESRLKVLEATNQRLEAERELKQATNREAELRHEKAKTQAERDAFVQGWRQDLAEELVKALRERDQAAEQMAKAQRRGELVSLRSPAPAMVLETARRSVGSVVREAEALFTLAPLDAPLEAEVLIEARDIGFVRVGDPVRVKLDAFPFQKHGTASGRVRSISEDVVQQSVPGEEGQEKKSGLFYLCRLTLEEPNLRAVPADFRLLPGMSLTGEIKVGSRRVISYLLYPIMRGFDESLREP